MAGGNIGPKIGLDGEKEFKQQINECNNSLKTMGTEMAKVTSAFIGNENSSKALKAANKQLTAQFEELSNKADISGNVSTSWIKPGSIPHPRRIRSSSKI